MFSFDVPENAKLALGTLYLRFFGWTKIPLLLYIRPTLVTWTDENIEFKVPLTRRTKNHVGSMYFAALAAGADLAAGFVAMDAIRKSRQPVSLIFKNMRADFLKRAEGDVLFTCTESTLIKDLVEKAIETGERVELEVPVTATVPKFHGSEPIARFTLTLSLKLKQAKQKARASAAAT